MVSPMIHVTHPWEPPCLEVRCENGDEIEVLICESEKARETHIRISTFRQVSENRAGSHTLSELKMEMGIPHPSLQIKLCI